MDIKPTVLIIEDEDVICSFISAISTSDQYQVVRARTRKEDLSLFTPHVPDIVLPDLGLPDIDGTEIPRQIREWSKMPVIVVSVRGHEYEKVSAFDLGADDYIIKPLGTSELLAWIRTAMRHSLQSAGTGAAGEEKVTIRELEIDYDKRTVSRVGERIHLTPIEYRILVLLSQNADKMPTHDSIIREVWGVCTDESYILRVSMTNIRRRIKASPEAPKHILTEMGIGHRMVEEPVEK